jgi:hypothetical protein
MVVQSPNVPPHLLTPKAERKRLGRLALWAKIVHVLPFVRKCQSVNRIAPGPSLSTSVHLRRDWAHPAHICTGTCHLADI